MSEALKARIRQPRFEDAYQEATLDLLAAANSIRDRMERTVAAFGITAPQYNVLRILRGAHPAGHPRGEIADRMLDRAPDVTRIIDRLEDKGLVARERTSSDRRHSITRITDAGLALLKDMEPALRESLDAMRRALPDADCAALSRICGNLLEALDS